MRSHAFVVGFTVFLTLCTASPFARAAAEADDPDYRLFRLLDADTAPADRQLAFEQFRQQALAGDTYSQYVVGSLYRAGSGVPHSVVKRDVDEAARYLSSAAAHGYLSAMAKMAELELARGHSLEAMIWAQLYGHYTNAAKPRKSDNKGNDYLADLLHRIYERFDESKMGEVDADANAFVAQHDADVRAGIAASRQRYAAGGAHRKKLELKFDRPPTDLAHARIDTLSDYVIAFSADGRAQQALLLDAVPDMRTGIEMRSVALRMQVDADAASNGLRYALVPVRLTYSAYSLHATP